MAEAKLAEKPVAAAGAEVLTVKDLQAWYGESHILHGINFNVRAGEVVTLLGRNGAGKTTTLKSVMGIIGKRTGSVRFDGQEIIRTSSDRIARMGIADEINAKATIVEQGFTAERLVSGEADLAVQQISELKQVEGIEVIGPVPHDLQTPAVFSAGRMVDAKQAAAADRLLRFLASSEVVPVLRQSGLEP